MDSKGTVSSTKAAFGELLHKINIVSDEPELQESYGVQLCQVSAVESALKNAESVGVLSLSDFSDAERAMLEGEADDAAVVARDRADDCRNNNDLKGCRAEQKLARELECICDAIAAYRA